MSENHNEFKKGQSTSRPIIIEGQYLNERAAQMKKAAEATGLGYRTASQGERVRFRDNDELTIGEGYTYVGISAGSVENCTRFWGTLKQLFPDRP